MRFADYYLLAIKNLSRQKARTFLTIVAITIGSLSVILMASLIISVRQSLINSFKKMGAFNLVTVTRDPNTSDNSQLISSGNNDPTSGEGKIIDDKTLTALKTIPNVADATPILSVWVKTIRLDGQTKKMWSNLIGYQPETSVFDLPLLAGGSLTMSDMDKIVVGAKFTETYGFTGHPQDLIGKKVILNYDSGGGTAPDWGNPPEKPPNNAGKEWYDSQSKKGGEITAEIIGVADNKTMDDSQNYISLAWARRLMTQVHWEWDDTARKACEENNQKLQEANNQKMKETNSLKDKAVKSNLNLPDCSSLTTEKLVKEDNFSKSGYGSIILKVDNTANIKSVAGAAAKLGYGVTTAENMISQINRMLAIIGLVLGLIGGISLFVAAIGIINTMIMATYERIREIGVMRACGATRGTILFLFSIEAALLGFWGGVFGMTISYVLGLIARILVQKFGASLGNIPIDQIGTFPLWLIGGVITFTTLIGIISGLYPAIRASRLNPVDALRYE
jgi:ABC-type antimicrobial peptide transport system permease subunit